MVDEPQTASIAENWLSVKDFVVVFQVGLGTFWRVREIDMGFQICGIVGLAKRDVP